MTESMKIAIIILEPLPGDTSRVYRGMKTAKEFADAGDDVVVLFDGSGVEALAVASASDHAMHGLLSAIRPAVRGACKFCAISHKVRDQIEAAGWALIDDYAGEASVRDLVLEGRQVLTF